MKSSQELEAEIRKLQKLLKTIRESVNLDIFPPEIANEIEEAIENQDASP